nr:RICIN domain-containing protein [Streptomyces sp. TLI_235]
MSYRPALSAAKATAALALVPGVLLGGSPAGPAAASAADDPVPAAAPYEDPGHRSADAAAPLRPLHATADPLPDRGLGVITAHATGLRLQADDLGSSRAADGAELRTAPVTGADAQEWLVRPAADGRLLVQSLLAGDDTAGPLLLTAEPDGTVHLRTERAGPMVDDPAQVWSFVRVGAADPWHRESQPARARFTIRADGGGCLTDRGPAAAPVVGSCDTPRAWWTADGLTT